MKIHFMIHEYVLFLSRISSCAYAQVHDECWPVFDQRIAAAVTSGKTIDDCLEMTQRLFVNISRRFFMEKRTAKILDIILSVLKNTKDYVAIIENMKHVTDQTALSKAFKKFHDFQSLKKVLLKVLRAISPNVSLWFDDVIS